MRGVFLQSRAKYYEKSIHHAGSPLTRCVGFIDCTKIRMCSPSGANDYQVAVCFGHKRIRCLIYQTITTPNGLTFSLYGTVEMRRHDLTLLGKSGWSDVWLECIFIAGEWYYITVIQHIYSVHGCRYHLLEAFAQMAKRRPTRV